MIHWLLHFAEDNADGVREVLVVIFMTVGIVLVAIMLTTLVRGKLANRQANRPTAREQIDRIKAAGRQRSRESGPTAEEVEQVRHLAIVLDNKAERLEQLIAQADARIEALQGSSDEGTQGQSDDATERQRTADQDPFVAQSLSRSVPEPLDPLTRSVYELADDGFSPIEIARKLDEQVGKVDLILALRRQ